MDMMEYTNLPLIQTKTTLPEARPNMVDRPLLIRGVFDQPYFRVLLVCAPAGYGKTTFLGDLARMFQKTGQSTAWFSLDPFDDDPKTFGRYLVQTLVDAMGNYPGLVIAGQTMRSSSKVSLQNLTPALINTLSAYKKPILLVIDDYHLIKNSEIHETVKCLIEKSPENLKIALGTRSRPPLPLARYRGRGQLLEIETANLRFDLFEAEQFFRQSMNLSLPDEKLRILEDQTEGWPAGLQLAALALSRGESASEIRPGKQKHLAEYLLAEVFEGLPGGIQEFMLKTSILDRLSASLCDALTGHEGNGRTTLDFLESNNLFLIPLDSEGQWYRFHHLFRDFLFSRLKKEDEYLVTRLHQTASDWYSANGLLRESAVHAFASGDWKFAAKFVEAHSFEMILHSELALLSDWCGRFPENIFINHPRLCISQCWGWVFSFQKKFRKQILGRLEFAHQALSQETDQSTILEIEESSKIIQQLISLAPDFEIDIHGALGECLKLLQEYREDDPSKFSILLTLGYISMALNNAGAAKGYLENARKIAIEAGLFFGMVESSFHLARLAQVEGRLEEALLLVEDTRAAVKVALAQPEKDLPGLGCLDIAAGCVQLEQNRVDEAEEVITRGMTLVGLHMNPYYVMAAQVALYSIKMIAGRAEEAERCLENLEMIWPDISFFTRGLRLESRAWRKMDDSTRIDVEQWLTEMEPICVHFKNLPGFGPFAGTEIYFQAMIIWIRLNLLVGNSDVVKPRVENYYHSAVEKGIFSRAVELLLIRLSISSDHDCDNPYWQDLKKSLYISEKQGFFNIFSVNDRNLPVLIKARDRGYFPAYLDKLIAELNKRESEKDAQEFNGSLNREGIGGLRIQLSPREMEILWLMERGESNNAIAARLFITEGTVKSHVNHILAKLGAENRTRAVAMAREAGFFNDQT